MSNTNFEERIEELEGKIAESKELIALTKSRIYEIENYFTAEILEVIFLNYH